MGLLRGSDEIRDVSLHQIYAGVAVGTFASLGTVSCSVCGH